MAPTLDALDPSAHRERIQAERKVGQRRTA
jgi:hypothetical protein